MSVLDKVQMLKQILVVILKVAEIIAKAIECITDTIKDGGNA